MKIIFLFTALIFLTIKLSPQGKDGPGIKDSNSVLEAKREKFDPKRDANKDIQNAIKIATEENKRILLDVGGEWCIWCHRMDYFFLSNSDIYDLLHDNFVVVKINYSEENKNEVFLSRFPKVAGYPHIFILDKHGNLLHSENTGDLEAGKGYDHEKVIKFLNTWILKPKS